MPLQDVRDRVATIVAETLVIPREEVVADLGYGVIEAWDSVGHLDLLLALEQTFRLPMTADLIPLLTSVRAIEQYVADHAAA